MAIRPLLSVAAKLVALLRSAAGERTAHARSHPYRSPSSQDAARPWHRDRRWWWLACDLAILVAVCVLGSGRAPDRSHAHEPDRSPAGEPDLSPYSAHVYLYRDFDGAPLERITIDIADGEGRVRYERLMDEQYVREGTMTRTAVALLRPALVKLLPLRRFPIGYTGRLHVVVNGIEWTSLSNAPPRPDMPHEAVELASGSEFEEGLRIEGEIVRAARKATGIPDDPDTRLSEDSND